MGISVLEFEDHLATDEIKGLPALVNLSSKVSKERVPRRTIALNAVAKRS
jgi:hypothetical protein